MYYPKSQITTNLYTPGNELMIASSKLPYEGSYYKLSNGKKFMGEIPTGSPVELVEIEFLKNEASGDELTNTVHVVNYEDESIIENYNYRDSVNLALYNNLKRGDLNKNRSMPQPISFNERSGGGRNEVRRYFAKRNNQPLYIEISSETYKKFKFSNPNVAFDLYTVLSIPFNLGGDAASINRKIIDNIEKDFNWVNFHHFFKGKFSINGPTTESFYTRGGEFLLPNRTNYIGFYHLMPDGRAMTGKYHGDGAEIILIPLNNRNISQSGTSTIDQTIQVSTPTPTTISSGGGGGGGY